VVGGRDHSIEDEACSCIDFLYGIWVIEMMIGVFNVESTEHKVPKGGVESVSIGIELIDSTYVLFRDEVCRDCLEAQMVSCQVLKGGYAESLSFSDQ
jgi:hypothetical protein